MLTRWGWDERDFRQRSADWQTRRHAEIWAALRTMIPSFERAIASFAETTVKNAGSVSDGDHSLADSVAGFLLAVHERMPDHLRLPFRVLMLVFDAWPLPRMGKPFHQLEVEQRAIEIANWKKSRLELRRRLMEFYGSLALFGLYSELYGQDYRYE